MNDDARYTLLAIFVSVVMSTFGFFSGMAFSQKSVVKDCELMGTFYVRDVVYICDKKK